MKGPFSWEPSRERPEQGGYEEARVTEPYVEPTPEPLVGVVEAWANGGGGVTRGRGHGAG